MFTKTFTKRDPSKIIFFQTDPAMCIITAINTHRRQEMRTNVVIDDKLMESALKMSGLKTKKDAIEEGLKLLVQLKGQEKIKGFRGKLKWTGNLDEMRLDK
jgi:Arc/MetJ family transcription regulator